MAGKTPRVAPPENTERKTPTLALVQNNEKQRHAGRSLEWETRTGRIDSGQSLRTENKTKNDPMPAHGDNTERNPASEHNQING
jgi:hypothetical protein